MSVPRIATGGTPLAAINPALPSSLRWTALLLLALLAVGWRLSALEHSFSHPDEPIALAVVDRVIEERTLDTNWARTRVPEHFRYNQYNFSAYYIFSAGLETLAYAFDGGAANDEDAARKRLRTYSALLGGICVLLAGWLGFRLRDTTAGLAGALLTLASAPLFQDAIYARPEAFCTVLALSSILLMTGKQALIPMRLALVGLLLGLLVATKLTFVLLLPFPIAALVALHTGAGRIRTACTYVAAVALGVVAGAPWAVAHPAEYVEGISHLVAQYGNGHGRGPHGLPDGSLVERIGHGLSYLRYVVGLPTLAASGLGLAVLVRRRPIPEMLMIGAVLLTLVYFLQSRAFFERNLSHGLPVLFVMAGVGTSWLASRLSTRPGMQATATIALVAALALPAYSVTRKLAGPALSKAGANDDLIARARLKREGFILVGGERVRSKIPSLLRSGTCGRFAFRAVDYGDRYFKSHLDRLVRDHGVRVAARINGPFHDAPPSTLQTYHAADILYLTAIRDGRQCAYEFVGLPEANGNAVETEVELRGAAARNAYHPGAKVDGWETPLYATWAGNDANTGRISLETRAHCTALLVPFIYGPKPQGIDIEITRIGEDGSELKLHSGVLPVRPSYWAALLLTPGSTHCSRYRFTLHDTGTGWGQWGGIGQPVAAPAMH